MLRQQFGAMAFAGASLILTSGCYFESIDDKPQANEIQKVDRGAEGSCHLDLVKGCFDGNVVALQDLFVDGKSFLNADALQTRFDELVTIEKDGLELTAGKDFELALVQPIGNASFANDFTYDLTGKVARRDRIRNDGNFAINDLPDGTYDLRVQRPIKFDVITETAVTPDPNAPVDPNAPAPAPTVAKKRYCATLYADTTVEIRRGQRAGDTFDDFQLYVTDDDCSDVEKTSLSAPN